MRPIQIKRLLVQIHVKLCTLEGDKFQEDQRIVKCINNFLSSRTT